MSLHDDWDQYFDPSTREMRREKRIASKTDRSKYKKTDQDKAFGAQKKIDKPLSDVKSQNGRVFRIQGQEILVFSEGITYVCSLKGTLKQDHSREKNLVVVGDKVDFISEQPQTGCIEKIYPRTSFLCRQDHLDRIKQQLLATNVDQIIIVVSLAQPTFTTSLIDRYLITARKGNMEPIIVINKYDLSSSFPQEAQFVEECSQLYRSLNIKTLCLSGKTGENLPQLQDVLKNRVSVFSGPSGSGKTFLLNYLTNSNLTTRPIRHMGKGAHTTSCAQLLPLTFEGWVVDTPGIRSLGIFNLTKEDLQDEFLELFSQKCGFTSCSHTEKEQLCAIPKAIKEGKVSPLRYLSYISLLKSLKESRKRR
jgi:ribosome biogenesis GTPase / thiamine phosphate phosphatase